MIKLLMVFFISLMYSEIFRESLNALRNANVEKCDSLLKQAYFEADSLEKNDVLFMMEILEKYPDFKILSLLSEFYLHIYFGEKVPKYVSRTPEDDLGTYLLLLGNITQSTADLSSNLKLIETIQDTLLKVHGALLLCRSFINSNKRECINLLESLIKSNPQTPYSELLQGYLEIYKKR